MNPFNFAERTEQGIEIGISGVSNFEDLIRFFNPTPVWSENPNKNFSDRQN